MYILGADPNRRKKAVRRRVKKTREKEAAAAAPHQTNVASAFVTLIVLGFKKSAFHQQPFIHSDLYSRIKRMNKKKKLVQTLFLFCNGCFSQINSVLKTLVCFFRSVSVFLYCNVILVRFCKKKHVIPF